jgi:hypothetical protein
MYCNLSYPWPARRPPAVGGGVKDGTWLVPRPRQKPVP